MKGYKQIHNLLFNLDSDLFSFLSPNILIHKCLNTPALRKFDDGLGIVKYQAMESIKFEFYDDLFSYFFVFPLYFLILYGATNGFVLCFNVEDDRFFSAEAYPYMSHVLMLNLFTSNFLYVVGVSDFLSFLN